MLWRSSSVGGGKFTDEVVIATSVEMSFLQQSDVGSLSVEFIHGYLWSSPKRINDW